jgi:glycosyltransferase involved in cell wall biosynthesis
MSGGMESNSVELPLVTVLVGCYNHARFVLQTLESVRHQTYPRIQLIIWDDCSQDNSVEVIRSWIRQHSFECVFLQHDRNRGLCRSLNEALALARGKYVATVAADDLWMPERIERQVRIMENAPADVGVVYSDAFQMDEDGNALPRMLIEPRHKAAGPPEGFIFDAIIEENFIPAMTTLVRRECFAQVGAYDEDLAFEDWDMWIRISRTFRFVYDKVPATKYRILPGSLSRRAEAMLRSTLLAMEKYLSLGWLSAQQRKAALYKPVWYLYRLGLPIPWRWKGLLLRHNRSAKAVGVVVCSTLGISYARTQQIRAFCVRLKGKLSGRKSEDWN